MGVERQKLLTIRCDSGERVAALPTCTGSDAERPRRRAAASRAIAGEVLADAGGAILVVMPRCGTCGSSRRAPARRGIATRVEHWLDTLVLRASSFAFHSYSLDALCRGSPSSRPGSPRRESDVRAMRTVFAGAVGVLAPVSARISGRCVSRARARQAIVDASKRRRSTARRSSSRTGPRDARRRSSRWSARGPLDLDPPGVVGYQPRTSRRQLRADRILRSSPLPSGHTLKALMRSFPRSCSLRPAPSWPRAAPRWDAGVRGVPQAGQLSGTRGEGELPAQRFVDARDSARHAIQVARKMRDIRELSRASGDGAGRLSTRRCGSPRGSTRRRCTASGAGAYWSR